MPDCPRCAAYREQISALQRELGLRMRDGAMGALMARFTLQPMQALLLVALYQAKGRVCGADFLVEFIGCPGPENIKVHVCRLRKALGPGETIENVNGLGYKLTIAGTSRVLAAISPADVQDPHFV